AELTLTRRKQQQETIEELTKAGVRPAVDAVRARVELLGASYLFKMRQTEQRAAFAALAASVGGEPERGLQPAALDGSVFAGPTDVAEASTLAQRHRPELAQLRAQVEQFDESERAARGQRAPTGGVFARGSTTYYDVVKGNGIDGDQYTGGGGVYLRWDAGDARIVRGRKVARARIEEARTRLKRTELSVRAEAVDAAYAVQRAQSMLDQANQVLEAAKAARTVQHERYGVGMASLLELLDAEAIEQNARRTRIEAMRDFDLSRARVLAVCGTLGEQLL
ncbi:MAG: TolC family protein, partial [Polyangiales bacterium]